MRALQTGKTFRMLPSLSERCKDLDLVLIFTVSAALAQSVEVVELLVGRRASVKARDVDGRTPLHGAIVRGARACDVARLLLSAGADPNEPDNFGYTPLHIAALNEFSACVLLLLGEIFYCLIMSISGYSQPNNLI